MGDHHHHHGGCAHEHIEEPEAERGLEWGLYQFINTERVWCLNEQEPGSSISVFKPWDKRKTRTPFLESDVDEELIIHIPFTGGITLKSICIVGGGGDQSPSRLKAFINREDIDFSTANDLPPVQSWELAENEDAEIEYPTRISKFQNITSLTLYIPENFGAETTVVTYIGLRGTFKKMERKAVGTAYELRPQLADHKLKEDFGTSREV